MRDIAYELIYESELNHWWDKARRKIVFSFIKRYYPLHQGRPKILDLGCGMGVMAKEALQIGDYHGLDSSEKAVNFCKERGVSNVIQGDASHIPHPDGQFDIVILMDVLEHIKDDLRVIDEVKRVLRPGGVFIITAPAYQILWGPTDVTHQHYRRYRLHELVSKIKLGGLSVLKSSYFNTFLFPPIFLYRMAVKYLPFPIKSENELSRQTIHKSPIINGILYFIFSLELVWLKFANFPFGISVVVIGRKDPLI